MSRILMNKFMEITELPKTLKEEIIEDLTHSPFHPDINNLTGYGVMSELQHNGNEPLTSKLLLWVMAYEPYRNICVDGDLKAMEIMGNDY